MSVPVKELFTVLLVLVFPQISVINWVVNKNWFQ